MFRIIEAIQDYAWGSPSTLQDLLGRSEPVLAEAWFGTHVAAPSLVAGDTARSLGEVIVQRPDLVLGADVIARPRPTPGEVAQVAAACAARLAAGSSSPRAERTVVTLQRSTRVTRAW